jgi:GT2 family glycosyltransferase
MVDRTRDPGSFEENDVRDDRLAMVIVHYRDPAAVEGLLHAVRGWSCRPGTILIVDNSGDLPRPADPDVEVLDPGENLGYAAAVNRAWRGRPADRAIDRLLICTQDAHLDRDALRELTRVMSSDDTVSVCAPMLRFRSNPEVVFSRGGRLSERGVAMHVGFREGHAAGPFPVAPGVVEWADGAVLLVRGAMLDAVGGMPEEYFLYVEEIDFQLQCRLRGGRVVVVDSAIAYQEPGNYRTYLRFRNSVHFTRKYRDVFKPWPWGYILARDVYGSLREHRRFPVTQALRGVLHARLGLMGNRP